MVPFSGRNKTSHNVLLQSFQPFVAANVCLIAFPPLKTFQPEIDEGLLPVTDVQTSCGPSSPLPVLLNHGKVRRFDSSNPACLDLVKSERLKWGTQGSKENLEGNKQKLFTMKIFVATALLAVVLVAQAQAGAVKRDIFQSALDSLQALQDAALDQVFPKLMSLGQAGVTAIRHLALNFAGDDMLGDLKKQYKLARDTVSSFIGADLFDEGVNTLIPLIDNQHSVHECVTVCDGTAKVALDQQMGNLAVYICPAMCQGALAKLRHAAESLEENL
ncbi:hypothetical protein RRG08_019440 [Elysia crispata]|uniref:Uncharacterized protein n=1 Tax=Elysia crispata TaxID=231223 RepID=A0AAE0Z4U2_9GAST|nr:hypothetical protein RRG08_019440 [Elysia crispata]